MLRKTVLTLTRDIISQWHLNAGSFFFSYSNHNFGFKMLLKRIKLNNWSD